MVFAADSGARRQASWVERRAGAGTGTKRLPKRIGVYDVERRLAAGGMGEVLLGFHPGLHRAVALKRVVAPDSADAAQLAGLDERFQREGRMLAQLHHQGICGVYDLFSWRSRPWIALEFVDGYDLRTLLRHGALPVDVALIVAEHVADALAHAHLGGVVHRDIKPANVMVSRRGEVKLMDFGIARSDELGRLTSTGLVVGTPIFMAPEVLKGEDACAASDVYSLGAMLYRSLAGRPMFRKADKEVMYKQIITGQIRPLRAFNSAVPRRVARLVHRALARDPAKRQHSASQLRHELQDALTALRAPLEHEERLVQFLYVDGHLAAEDALTVVKPDVLEASRRAPPARPHTPWWRWAAALMLATSLGGVGLWALDRASLDGAVVDALLGWMQEDGRP